MFVTLFAFAVSAMEPQAAPVRPSVVVTAPAASEAMRCAGLTQAASELNGDRSGDAGEAKGLYDAGLYWALTAMQAARSAGRTEEAAEADQTRSRTDALARLREGSTDAQADLARCLARTPNLD